MKMDGSQRLKVNKLLLIKSTIIITATKLKDLSKLSKLIFGEVSK